MARSETTGATLAGRHGRVSVLVSSYNYAAYVVDAVRSALAQAPPPHEVIVVDDGSTDGSVEALQAAFGTDPRVLLITQANGGQMAAWIAGFRHATGDIVAFLDSDDLWEPGYLARVVDIFDDHPGVDYVYGNMRKFGARTGLMGRGPSRDIGYSVLLAAFLQRWQSAATSAISVRRDLLARVFALPPALVAEWRSRPDDCLSLGSELLGGRKYYFAEPLVAHREHDANALAAYTQDAAYRYRYMMRCERMLAYYRAQAGVDDNWLRMAKHEFRTRSHPTWHDMRGYSWLLWRSRQPLRKRLEQWLSMWAYFLGWGRGRGG
jgi:glycosyltransferase involved in cell wall biosynthesis